MKVLIVDDSKIVRELLVTLLSDLRGIDIIGQAEDTVEAVSSIQRLKPDLVILDIQMPGGSGITVLQSIKRNKPMPTVIMLTNYPYPQYRKKCLAEGADYFFDKSTEFHRVPEVCKELMLRSDIGIRES